MVLEKVGLFAKVAPLHAEVAPVAEPAAGPIVEGLQASLEETAEATEEKIVNG